MTVTWSTFNDTDSMVEFGTKENDLDRKTTGYSELFVDGGEEGRQQFIHRVQLKKLKPKTKYCEYTYSRDNYEWPRYF